MSRFKLVALIAIPLVILGAGLVYAHQDRCISSI
jgi:hypothetical protein